jgi:hypothetical protein
VAKTASKCVYDYEKCPQSAGVYPSHRAGDHPLGRRPGLHPVEIPAATLDHSPTGGVFADGSSPAELDRIPSTSSDATQVVTNEPASQQVFGTDQVSHGELVFVRKDPPERCVSLDTSPSVFTFPSFFLPTLLPEPWIPLSFLGEERLQVQISDTAATDLDMKWCVLE